MKRSERIALGCATAGIATGVAMWYFSNDWFPTWTYFVAGAVVAGTFYNNFLRMVSQESIIDSKTINRK